MIDNICGKHYSGIILLNQLFSINILKIVHHEVNKKTKNRVTKNPHEIMSIFQTRAPRGSLSLCCIP